MNGHAIKELARAWAAVAHDGQSRKGAGEPYFDHAERVANAVWGWRRKSLAYLHDVIEDAEDPLEMERALRAILPGDLIDDVLRLSRLPDESGKKQTYKDWIQHMMIDDPTGDVIPVKIADLFDNLSDIHDIPGMENKERQYIISLAALQGATGKPA